MVMVYANTHHHKTPHKLEIHSNNVEVYTIHVECDNVRLYIYLDIMLDIYNTPLLYYSKLVAKSWSII